MTIRIGKRTARNVVLFSAFAICIVLAFLASFVVYCVFLFGSQNRALYLGILGTQTVALLFLVAALAWDVTLDFSPIYLPCSFSCILLIVVIGLWSSCIALNALGVVLVICIGADWKIFRDVLVTLNLFFFNGLYIFLTIETSVASLCTGKMLSDWMSAGPGFGVFLFVLLYYVVYREDRHEYIISNLFKKDRYGIVLLFALAKLLKVFWIQVRAFTEFDLLQLAFVLLIFLFHTDEEKSKAAVHLMMVIFYGLFYACWRFQFDYSYPFLLKVLSLVIVFAILNFMTKKAKKDAQKRKSEIETSFRHPFCFIVELLLLTSTL